MTDLKAIAFACGANHYWARTAYDASTARWIIRIHDENNAVVTGFEAFVHHDEVHDMKGDRDNPQRVETATRALIRDFIHAGGEPRRYPED